MLVSIDRAEFLCNIGFVVLQGNTEPAVSAVHSATGVQVEGGAAADAADGGGAPGERVPRGRQEYEGPQRCGGNVSCLVAYHCRFHYIFVTKTRNC